MEYLLAVISAENSICDGVGGTPIDVAQGGRAGIKRTKRNRLLTEESRRKTHETRAVETFQLLITLINDRK